MEVAEDEEFLEGGQILEDGVGEAGLGEGELDGGFKVGADLFGLTGGFDGLLDDGAGLQQLFDGGGGLGAGERCVRLREGFEVDAVAVAEELPGFVGGVGEDGGEEFGERLGDLADGGLGGATAGAVGGIAVHPVLGDVDVEGGEVARDELGDGGDDFAEIVGGVAGEAVGEDAVEALEDPAVDQGEGRGMISHRFREAHRLFF